MCQASAYGHVAVTWAATPLLLGVPLPPPVPGWLERHIAHLPAPPSMLPSSRLSPNRSRHLLQEGSRHRPSLAPTAQRCQPTWGRTGRKSHRSEALGAWGLWFPSDTKPFLRSERRAELLRTREMPAPLCHHYGARWGIRGRRVCPPLLSRTVMPRGLLWPSYRYTPPTPSLVPALSSPCPSISEFCVFLGLS